MQANRIIHLAAQMGRMMLENGGETYRVEETARRVCDAFGLTGAQIYATPTALILSVTSGTGESLSVMERIYSRGVNLDKIDALNQLSRTIEAQGPDVDAACAMLEEVRCRRQRGNPVLVLFSALACAVFPLLFGGTLYDILPAFIAGALVRISSIFLSRIRLNDFFINVIGGVIASFTGWLTVAVGMGQSIDAITTSAIMLMVPGLTITNAVRDIASGDLLAGTSRLMEAFCVAIAIACGTALAYLIIAALGGGLR